MTRYTCLNGQFISDEKLISPDNRAFCYGDGLFESIRLSNGQLRWIDDHFERLLAGMFTLGFDTTLFHPVEIAKKMFELTKLNQEENARIRLTVFREIGGKYKPDSDRYEYLITSEPLTEAHYQLNRKGLKTGLFTEIRKPSNMLASLKSANALLYVMAGRYARDASFDEAFILNEQGRICEANSSNLFVVFPGGKIVTPASSEGILPGVMRKNLIRLMHENGIQIEETQILPEDLFKAEEIFLSNAIQGIRWVLSYRERRYYSKFAQKIANLIPV